MATLFAGNNGGIDLSTFDLEAITTGIPTTKTASDYVLPAAEFKGFGFEYTDVVHPDALTAGTITDIIVFNGALERYQITGLLLPVADVDKFIADSNNSQGFLGEIFAGADVMDGSNVADHLIGFGDNDTIGGNGGNDTLDGGDGKDRLDGDAANDSLSGNAGDDTLDGGAGNDSMDGGAGNDQYFADASTDVAKDTGAGPGTETDTVISTADYVLDISIENLTLIETATKGTGNANANLLIGNDGNNTLDGAAGADTMQGGKGNDVYIVDNTGDTIKEDKNAGTDLVNSSVTFTLAANVENLTLTGSDTINGAGNELNNVITGNGVANKLEGLANSDTLSGGDGNDTLDGGTGNDRMIGGKGDDTFIVDSVQDVIVEALNEGNDTVVSTVSFSFAGNETLNNLVLQGPLDLKGTGNVNANDIVGNAGRNVLDGGLNSKQNALVGDTLEGGANDDTYIVHNVNDKIVETGDVGAGHDTVNSFISWTLGANLEDLVLVGTAAINGTGNELANKLTGNAAANKLDGGLGDDTMIGAAGDDSYVVDSVKDVITDSSGTGDEVFFTGKDPALVRLYTGIEHYNFSLLDVSVGPINFTGTTAANRITGTTLADTLVGGSGNDTLIGGDGTDSLNGGVGSDRLDGGAGLDTMDGGTGNDTYVIDSVFDIIIETGKDTSDTVETAAVGLHIDLSATINGVPIFGGIENVTFTGSEDLNATGTAVKNILTGNAGDNDLEGLDGNDTIVGGAGADTLGGGKGADSMAGGADDDIYDVDVTGDKIFEDKGGGVDVVRSTISYILGANLEALVLQGGDLNGTGNSQENAIVGTNGKNILDGKGGDDILQGLDGDDTYIVDSSNDEVDETLTGGHDLVKSTADYTLAIGDNIEDLMLLGTFAINASGNELANVLTGNSATNKLDGGAGADTMIGGGGDDIYTVGNLGDKIIELANGGLNDTVKFTITDPLLEKLISGVEHYDFSLFLQAVTFTGDNAANRITGSEKDGDSLSGGNGNDTLDGNVGVDTLVGGMGNDSLVVDDVNDVTIELSKGGTDTIVSMLDNYVLSDLNFENLTMGGDGPRDGVGNKLNNVLTGNGDDNKLEGVEGNDTILGDDGDDTLDGGSGNDSMSGGFGGDTYILDNKSDRIVEFFGRGIDTVIASFDYTLLANFDNLVLADGSPAIKGTGNADTNHITGNENNNILDGKAGADFLVGGTGDDTYIVDTIKDLITEDADAGNDTVKVSTTQYSLAANIENLIFTSTKDSLGFGNGLDNHLTGGAGNDSLQGDAGKDTLEGGAGADTLFGDTDDDTYIIDSAKDVIHEFGGGGTDTILSKITIDLNSANYKAPGGLDTIENVTLTGTGALNATGNSLGNHLIGNTGVNILDGKDGVDTLDGGAGNDVLIGGKGDDHIDVTLGNDVVRYTSALDGHDIVSGFDGNATGGQDTLNLDALFDSLSVAAADRAGRVSFTAGVGSVDVHVDVSALHDGSNVITVATLNLANPADAITVGQDVIVGT